MSNWDNTGVDINAISTFAKTKAMQDRASIQCWKIKGLECSGKLLTVFPKKFSGYFSHAQKIFSGFFYCR